MKNKLEVSQFVRTKYGISKIVNVFFEKTGTFIETDNGLGNCNMSTREILHKGIYILEEDYKSFIDNNVKNTIIDLIQEGDYVNGSKVVDISIIGKDKEKWVRVEQMEDTDNKYGDDYVGYNNEQIKSIVTKEQFESMSYKVGE